MDKLPERAVGERRGRQISGLGQLRAAAPSADPTGASRESILGKAGCGEKGKIYSDAFGGAKLRSHG